MANFIGRLRNPRPFRRVDGQPLAGGGSEALRLMRSAAHWFSSKDGDGQLRPNRGTGGGTMQRGSTTGVDTNDYTHLPHTGEDYVWLPADTSSPFDDYLTQSFAVSGGDRSVEWHGRLGQVTTGQEIAGWVASGSPIIFINGSGNLRVYVRGVTTAASFIDFGNPGIAAEEDVHLRAERVKSTGQVSAQKSSDGVTWVDVGPPQTYAPGEDLLAGTVIRVGQNAIGLGRNGDSRTYSARFEADGVVRTLDPSDLTGWTVNRSSSGLKTAVVTRPVDVYDGVDDYGQLPASATPTFTATTGKHTVVVAYRRHGTPTTNHQLWDARSSGAAGADLVLRPAVGIAAYVRGADSSALASVTSLSDGSIEVAAYVQDEGSVAAYGNANGLSSPVDVTGVGTIAFSSTPKVGTVAYGSGVNQAEVEVFDILDFPGVALTEEELDTIATKLKAGTYS